MRKTKIICTLGPSTDNEAVLRQLIRNGMNLARFNFSHGSHEEHFNRLQNLRRIVKEEGATVATLLDTKGPEIRTGKFHGGKVELTMGEAIVIRNAEIMGTKDEFSVTYKQMHQDLKVESPILIDDGSIELKVEKIDEATGDIYCRIQNGGFVSDYKSINLPNASVKLPALTERDINDLRFAVENDMDFIAASFVRRDSDVIEIRQHLERFGSQDIRIIAKIENREGVDNFEDILRVSDAIMVARGDLGVEIPAYEVPSVQKHLIKMCYRFGKPVITATQMLDSMIRNPRPTRAEVSDVANAIMDGTSAIMLSGETAAGRYPVDAFNMMARVAEETERHYDYWDKFKSSYYMIKPTVNDAISHASCTTAMDLNAKAIVAMSISGRTARSISSFRPACPIIATAASEKVTRQLQLSWGVIPYLVAPVATTDEVFAKGMEVAVGSKLVDHGDVVVITCGTPVGTSGTTNTLKVQTIGSVLCQGKGLGSGVVSKEVVNLTDVDLEKKLPAIHDKVIVVSKHTDDEVLPILRQAAGIIVEDPNPNSHTITVAKTLNIPVIYDCVNASSILRSGIIVSMDLDTGIIS